MSVTAARPRRVAKADDPFSLAPRGTEAIALRAIRALLEAAVAAVTVEQIESAIEHPSEIDGLRFDLDTAAIESALLGAVEAAAVREARGIRTVKAEGIIRTSFDLADPGAAAWARERAAALVVEISESTRESIRSLIVRAVAEGGHPTVIAREIKPLVGLHSRWATAVLNYRYRMDAAGLKETQVAANTARYYGKLLTTRSRTIARTEILQSANQGKLLAWHQAQASGLLPANATKVWVAADDAEEVCASLDGTEVGLREEFSTEMGDVEMPPLHPNCRCTCAIGNSGRILEGGEE